MMHPTHGYLPFEQEEEGQKSIGFVRTARADMTPAEVEYCNTMAGHSMLLEHRPYLNAMFSAAYAKLKAAREKT